MRMWSRHSIEWASRLLNFSTLPASTNGTLMAAFHDPRPLKTSYFDIQNTELVVMHCAG